MTAVIYVHEPLGNPYEQVRLLTILPARDNTSPIMTQLSSHKIPLSNASRLDRLRGHFSLPTYFAISYVCGSGREMEKTHSIFIEGKAFPVAANVHAALHVYRDFTTAPMDMWIDCICISQTDDNERSAQITLMRDIYFLALGVYIWLGPATPESDRAIRFVNNLTNSLLMNRAVNSVIELHALETKDKLEGSQPSLMESWRRTFLRNGYAALLTASMPLAGAAVGFADLYSNSSRSDQSLSPQPLVMYPDDYRPGEGPSFQESYNKGLEQTERKRAIMNGRETTFDGSKLGLYERIGQAYQDVRRNDLEAKANLMARTDINYNAMGIAERHRARNDELNRIKAEQIERLEAWTKLNGEVSDQGDMSLDSGHTGSEKKASWRPSNNALDLVKSEDLMEMAQLIEKTLVQETQYFSRMWTLQEACVGAVAMVCRGTSQALFKDLLKVMRYLNETLKLRATDISQVNKIQWINSGLRGSRRLSLRILLHESQERECQDPRDKIYALVGLMRETPNSLLRPSYEKPVSEVYADAARFLINSNRGLDIICEHDIEFPERFPGLPSWTPDFRYFGSPGRATPLADVSGRSNIFHACKSVVVPDSEGPITLPRRWNALRTTGLHFGTVCNISESKSSEVNVDSKYNFGAAERRWNATAQAARSLNSAFLSALNLSSQLITTYQKLSLDDDTILDPDPGLDQLCQQLASVTAEFHDLDVKSHAVVLEYLLVLLCGRTTSRSGCTADDLELLMSQACLRDATGVGETARATLCTAFSTGMRGRRLAAVQKQLTVRGDADLVLAAMPKTAEVGDMICILAGCSVPICIRPLGEDVGDMGNEDRHKLVGECYVSGFMDGEAWPRANHDNTQLHDFLLV